MAPSGANRTVACCHEKQYVSDDKYGARFVTWVRLYVIATGRTLFFANTHGPLNKCFGWVGKHVAYQYGKAINDNKAPTDMVIFAGDFNCGSDTATIVELKKQLSLDGTDQSFSGSDHIFSSGLGVLWEGHVDGTPSDHELLKVTLRLPLR